MQKRAALYEDIALGVHSTAILRRILVKGGPCDYNVPFCIDGTAALIADISSKTGENWTIRLIMCDIYRLRGY